MTGTAPETLAFQAEVSRLIDIVANALYAKREVFLRELISNASDACDRLRYAALTQPALLEGDPELAVGLEVDKSAGVLTVVDNGIGMNREELISNLGTIARSGTAQFLDQLGDKKGELDLIGQFGVGFYSAFMAADRVVVETRRAGEEQGWRWESDGRSGFTLSPAEEAPHRGTRISLHLKDDAKEYLEAARLREIVKTYSDHLAIPVRLLGDGEPERLIDSRQPNQAVNNAARSVRFAEVHPAKDPGDEIKLGDRHQPPVKAADDQQRHDDSV